MSVVIALSLLHFLWQGTLIGIGASLAIKLVRSASARYYIGVAALALMAASPIVTANVVRGPASWVQGPDGSRVPSPESRVQGMSGVEVQAVSDPGPGNPGRTLDSGRWTLDYIVRIVRVSPTLANWLLGSWLFGVSLLSVRLSFGLWTARRLTRMSVRQPRPEILLNASRLIRALNITAAVTVLESALVHVPTAIGWLKPVVLLPAQAMTGLSMAQIDALVAHELAHIKRHDYLVNLFQSAIETLLFYHPAVWLISRRVRHERELCCDDLAIAACGDDRLTYVSALADLESLRQVAAPALGANGGSLLNRVRRILGSDEAAVATSRTSWTAGVAILATALIFVPINVVKTRATEQTLAQQAVVGGVAGGVVDTATKAGVKDGVEGGVVGGVPAGVANAVTDGVFHGIPGGVAAVQGQVAIPPRQTSSYVFRPSDTLRVRVYSGGNSQSDFTLKDYAVQRDGTIALPLIQPIKVADLAVMDADAAIQKALIEAKQYIECTVDIIVMGYHAEPVPGVASKDLPLPVPLIDFSRKTQDLPTRLYENAYNDYAGTKYELAIQGFQSYLRTYPDSSDAYKAQFQIGESHYSLGRYREAAQSYGDVIRNYANSPWIPDAYYKQGLAYQHLGDVTQARAAFEYVISNYPGSTLAPLARAKVAAMAPETTKQEKQTPVPATPKFFVQGFVAMPGEVEWEPNLTLARALDKAGGVTADGALNRVKVRRMDPATKEYKEVKLDKDKMSTLIEPNDIVEVPKRRMAPGALFQ